MQKWLFDNSQQTNHSNRKKTTSIYQTNLLWRINMTLTFLRLNYILFVTHTHIHRHARAHVSHTIIQLHHKLVWRSDDDSGCKCQLSNLAQRQHRWIRRKCVEMHTSCHKRIFKRYANLPYSRALYLLQLTHYNLVISLLSPIQNKKSNQ